MRKAIIVALAAMMAASPAGAQTAAPKPVVHAELVLSGPTRIRAFAPGKGGQGIYLQDSRRTWFYASFFPRCYNGEFATNIGLKPFAGGTRLIEGDTVFIAGNACRIETLTLSGVPPTRPQRVFRPRRILPSNGWRGAGQD